MTARPKRISFIISEEELATVKAYCDEKRRWRDPAALARDALWQHISRNPLSRLQEARVAESIKEVLRSRSAVLREGFGGKE